MAWAGLGVVDAQHHYLSRCCRCPASLFGPAGCCRSPACLFLWREKKKSMFVHTLTPPARRGRASRNKERPMPLPGTVVWVVFVLGLVVGFFFVVACTHTAVACEDEMSTALRRRSCRVYTPAYTNLCVYIGLYTCVCMPVSVCMCLSCLYGCVCLHACMHVGAAG